MHILLQQSKLYQVALVPVTAMYIKHNRLLEATVQMCRDDISFWWFAKFERAQLLPRLLVVSQQSKMLLSVNLFYTSCCSRQRGLVSLSELLLTDGNVERLQKTLLTSNFA